MLVPHCSLKEQNKKRRPSVGGAFFDRQIISNIVEGLKSKLLAVAQATAEGFATQILMERIAFPGQFALQ